LGETPTGDFPFPIFAFRIPHSKFHMARAGRASGASRTGQQPENRTLKPEDGGDEFLRAKVKAI
jgi:hypothetical protein